MARESDSAVLVTGATGFIGRHLVARLLNAGRQVMVWCGAVRRVSAEARIGQALGEMSDRVELLEGDLAYPSILEEKLRACDQRFTLSSTAPGKLPSWLPNEIQLESFRLMARLSSSECSRPKSAPPVSYFYGLCLRPAFWNDPAIEPDQTHR